MISKWIETGTIKVKSTNSNFSLHFLEFHMLLEQTRLSIRIIDDYSEDSSSGGAVHAIPLMLCCCCCLCPLLLLALLVHERVEWREGGYGREGGSSPIRHLPTIYRRVTVVASTCLLNSSLTKHKNIGKSPL